MPIIEHDPWREQYFVNVACPPDIVIPTDDTDSYRLYPEFRWIYNKLLICETQGIHHAPAGIAPNSFPVFSKPIVNLRGMGADSHRLDSPADYHQLCRPGHFWMEYFTGRHVRTDAAVVEGDLVWCRHTVGHSAGQGTFDHWFVDPAPDAILEKYCAGWLKKYLSGFTGMINIETIGGRIIEAQLRFADQWPDLYGTGWIEAMVNLYCQKQWQYADADRKAGYSVVLFGPSGRRYLHPPASLLQQWHERQYISSLQITFHPDVNPDWHAMPPGGFRLAVINCWDLAAGLALRDEAASFFGVPGLAR